MSYQQRAVLMSERVLGVDHPNTITEYVSINICSYEKYHLADSSSSTDIHFLHQYKFPYLFRISNLHISRLPIILPKNCLNLGKYFLFSFLICKKSLHFSEALTRMMSLCSTKLINH